MKLDSLIRKVNAPSSREQSYDASQCLKGPAGKGFNRYDVLNTKNVSTIEFRLFNGTMNPDSIFRYLEFVDALVRFVPSTSAKDEGVTFGAFLSWLIKDTFNVSRYEHLVGFCLQKDWINRASIRRQNVKTEDSGDGKAPSNVIQKKYSENVNKQPIYRLASTGNAPPPVVELPQTMHELSGLSGTLASAEEEDRYDDEYNEPDFDDEETGVTLSAPL